MTEATKPGVEGSDVDASTESRVGRKALIWTTHLRTVAWLCWQLWQQRWRRLGSLDRDLGYLAAFLAILAGCLSFVLALGLGWALLPRANPDAVLLTWAGLIAAFVFVRLLGVFASLQEGERLPLDNLLHLPFSLHQVFLLNFAYSQLTLTTFIFLPAFLGLAIASTVALDARNFVLIPASMSLFVGVEAIMYRVQGWITSAMGTKRRRVLIGYLVCTALIVAAQVSYVMYLGHQRGSETTEDAATSAEPGLQDVLPGEAGVVIGEEPGLSSEWLLRGWVARGSAEASEGFPWFSVIGMAGFIAIAILSLGSGYRGTLARYRHGQTASGRPRVGAEQQGRHGPARNARASPVVAIARITTRQWLRSLRALMDGLPTLALLVLFGSVWLLNPDEPDPYNMPLGVIVFMSMFCFPMELARNLFGLDGHGFRVYRFAGVPARVLLLGKYLALLPLFILLAGAVLTVSAVKASMLPAHVLGTALQGGVIFLACSAMGGAASLSSPYAVSPTSAVRRSNIGAGLLIVLAKLAGTGLLVLIAWPAISAEERLAEDGHAFPVYLLVSMVEFGLAFAGFRALVDRQARVLDERSDGIMEAVSVAE